MKYTLSQHLSHFFHVVSNIRPMVWIGIYVCTPLIFALIYWALPDYQFRIPEGAGSDYGSWLYYSIVTITTLGFGDYTPAHEIAQALTAIEVTLGLVVMGFFLNSVGSMKSEIDVESEIEKEKAIHHAMETEKLQKSIPMVINTLNIFIGYCFAVTTPKNKRTGEEINYNPQFKLNDMVDLFQPSGLPFDHTDLPAVERLMHSSEQTSLALDSLQQRIDLTLWPVLLENCFSFVANFQIFSNTDIMFRHSDHILLSEGKMNGKSAKDKLVEKIKSWNQAEEISMDPDLKSVEELSNFIRENANLAIEIETFISGMVLKDIDDIKTSKFQEFIKDKA